MSLRAAPAIAVAIIVFRDFAVSGLRTVAAQKGTVLAANMWGKVKTLITMIVMCAILLALELADIGLFTTLDTVLLWCRMGIWVASALTLVSAVSYFMGNTECLR